MSKFYTTTTHSVARNTVFTELALSTNLMDNLGFPIPSWTIRKHAPGPPVFQPNDYINILCLGIIYKDDQGRDISLFRCWDEDPTKYVEYYGIQGNELYEDLIV